MYQHFNLRDIFMDMSFFIAVAVPAAGAVLGWFIGRSNGLGKMSFLWFFAVLEAIALGVVLVIVQGLVYGTCAELLRMCRTQGDASLSNYIQPFFCIPLYWLIITVSAYWSRATKPVVPPVIVRLW